MAQLLNDSKVFPPWSHDVNGLNLGDAGYPCEGADFKVVVHSADLKPQRGWSMGSSADVVDCGSRIVRIEDRELPVFAARNDLDFG